MKLVYEMNDEERQAYIKQKAIIRVQNKLKKQRELRRSGKVIC